MSTTTRLARAVFGIVFLAAAAPGCDSKTSTRTERIVKAPPTPVVEDEGPLRAPPRNVEPPVSRPEPPARAVEEPAKPPEETTLVAEAVPPPETAAKVAEGKVPLGKNVFFENKLGKRRVLVNAYVCLREGQLEQLMCRKRTKEHEAIIAADADARNIHTALLLAGAKVGSTVRYQPKFQPATGTPIKVTLQYEDKGKTVTVPAQKWIRDIKNKKDLATEWVFAGSMLIPDPLDKDRPPFYAANSGDVICVSNFEDALLDLPINSSKENAELAFEANTQRIPPLETKVLVVLEPVSEKKK